MGESELKGFADGMIACEDEKAFEFIFSELSRAKPNADQWKFIAKETTGNREKTASGAQQAIKTFFRSRFLRRGSRENIAKVFP